MKHNHRSLPLLLLLVISLFRPPITHGTSIDEVKRESLRAYEAILEVNRAGGDTSQLIDKLNEALSLIEKAEVKGDQSLLDEAERLIGEIIAASPELIEEGLRIRRWRTAIQMVEAVTIILLGFLIYRHGPNLFWRLWIKLRGDYLIKRSGPSRNASMLVSGEVWAVITAIIIVGAVFALAQSLRAGRVVEPFSELGVLGPNMKIGDYPKTVVAGESFRLYLYIGNHMGKPMYYIILLKLGDRETPIDPAPLNPLKEMYIVLDDGENKTKPIDITLKEPGINKRLIFEMWIYNTTSRNITYHKRWCQLWINVTSPPL